ncbi:hypothetical protein H9P43_003111 [Blastocladiella emersonii ATCC 22665]|nr:hypothetical protein H9P43_003111 [Blastocladiella emersonii ATCC 22665]
MDSSSRAKAEVSPPAHSVLIDDPSAATRPLLSDTAAAAATTRDADFIPLNVGQVQESDASPTASPSRARPRILDSLHGDPHPHTTTTSSPHPEHVPLMDPQPPAASAAAPPPAGAAGTAQPQQHHAVDVAPTASFTPTPASGDERKSYQVRALVRKTISYQKRQRVTNFCCVSACPFLMVALSALLAVVLTNLVASSSEVQQYVACSNADAMNATTNTPLTKGFPTVDGSKVPGATAGVKVQLTNFLVTPVALNTGGPPSGGATAPCVVWTSPTYDTSPVYERDPFLNMVPPFTSLFNASTAQGQIARAIARQASVYQPDPKYGWLNPLAVTIPALAIPVAGAQQFPWAIVHQPRGVDLGDKNRTELVTLANAGNALQLVNASSAGFLGKFPTRLYTNITSSSTSASLDISIPGLQPVPFFAKQRAEDRSTEESIDKELVRIIKDTLAALSGVNKQAILSQTPDQVQLFKYQISIASIITRVPWGAVLYRNFDKANGNYSYTLQIGADRRIARAASFPAQGFRRFILNSMITNAILDTAAPGSSVVQGLRAFPSFISTAVSLPIGSFIGRILYPFGISFLLPIFIITLVKEKEDRIQVMMVMNGLKSSTYYLAHATHFYFLHLLSSIVFLASGYIFKLEFFTMTDPGVLIILFIVWGFVQIALAFFLAAFFSNSRNALVVSFLFVLLAVIVNTSTDNLITDQAPAAYLIWPAFAFYRALSLINRATFNKSLVPYTVSMLRGGDEVLRCLVFMIVEVFVYLLLAWYLSQVLKSKYGVSKRWNFIFVEAYERFSGKKQKQAELDRQNYVVAVNENETQFEDDDVRAERARVDENRFPQEAPLIIRHMRKIYSGTNKVAVKDVTFVAEEGEVFGLLGPNGAGKTSLISILTGVYEPTLGEAKLGGFDIATQRDDVYRITGICPQHDILWDDLTVGEHLLFYARLKGIPPSQENEAKDRALASVKLQAFENRLSKGLSGGEKRRLSIAIALTGDPKVVFLDEPTTGLDVLCSRLGIMAKGTMRCIGNQLRLKEKYGSGFKLTYITQPQHMAAATERVLALLPPDAKIADSFAATKTIEFMPTPGSIARIFDTMQNKAKEWNIEDWGLSQTSLEEVFLRLISETDAEGTAE